MKWFSYICLFGVFSIGRGFFTSDEFSLLFGIACVVLGANFSLLAPPNIFILILSVIAGFFFPPYTMTIAIGLIPIGIWTSYCLFTASEK